jgi:gamma-glutamyltranspeptidase/glutathione hydrolase
MKGVVACPQPWSAEVGANILEAGGNAFDAALACAFNQWVWDPFMCGPGGMGVAQLYDGRTGDNIAISFAARAGSKAREDMWASDLPTRSEVSSLFAFPDYRSELGYTSVMVPSVVAGLSEIHKRYATLPWSELMQPAIQQARAGLPVHPTFMDWFVMPAMPGQPTAQQRFSATAECARIFLAPGGEGFDYGDVIDMSDMADTLDRLARGGPGEFYKGELGQEIASDLAANGSFVTADDMRDYKPRVYEPLVGRYRGNKVTTVRPPDTGQSVLQALRLVEPFDLASMEHGSVEYLDVIGSALRLAHRDRLEFNADPEFVPVPVQETVLNEARLARQVEEIRRGPSGAAGDPEQEQGHTTTVSVADEQGSMVSLTHTLGWASGAVTPGLGFMYNNGMNLADPRPGRPNSIAPGKARMSNMVPTLFWQGDQPNMAVGALGGAVIVSAVFQVAVHMIDLGMSPGEAVSAARAHSEGGPLFLEARFRGDVAAELERMGHSVRRDPFPLSPIMARAQVAVRYPDGSFEGGSDPRAGAGGVAYSRI